MNPVTLCLWYDKAAEDAARFYAQTFPNSRVSAGHRAPADYPSGKAGDLLIVDFTVLGLPCMGLNGGPTFTPNEAFSFQVSTENQEELAAGGAKAKRAFGAMITMQKIDVAAIEAAIKG